MQRLIIALGAVLSVSCGDSGAVPAAPPEVSAQVTSLGVTATDNEVCRFGVKKFPKTMQLFEVTRRAGGRTCFSDGSIVVFLPKKNSSCEGMLELEYESSSLVSQQNAELEYTRCSAISMDSTRAPEAAVVFTKSESGSAEIDDAFIDFSLDLGALISNDGLPATYYYAGGGEICIESSHLARLREHIRESDIVDPSYIRESVRSAGCGRVG